MLLTEPTSQHSAKTANCVVVVVQMRKQTLRAPDTNWRLNREQHSQPLLLGILCSLELPFSCCCAPCHELEGFPWVHGCFLPPVPFPGYTLSAPEVFSSQTA